LSILLGDAVSTKVDAAGFLVIQYHGHLSLVEFEGLPLEFYLKLARMKRKKCKFSIK
jgi:hypothetical protein